MAVTMARRSPAIGCCRASSVVAALLDVEGERVELVVGVDERLRRVEVAVEERLGAARDRLGHQRRQAHEVVADLVELLVERSCRGLGHAGLTAPRRRGGRGRR